MEINYTKRDPNPASHFSEPCVLAEKLAQARKRELPGRGLSQYNLFPQHRVCCDAVQLAETPFSALTGSRLDYLV